MPRRPPSRHERNQEVHRARPGGADRSNGEDSKSDEENPLAPKPIRQAATDEQQPREDHGVGVDDPLQLARRGGSLRTRVGSATLRMVLSKLMIRAAADSTTSVPKRWGCCSRAGASAGRRVKLIGRPNAYVVCTGNCYRGECSMSTRGKGWTADLGVSS